MTPTSRIGNLVVFLKNLLELVILLLALPFLTRELFRNPAALSERMAGHHSLR